MSIFLTKQKIIKDWTDYNGHMNVAYYVLIFDQFGSEVLLTNFDMGEYSAKTTKKSTMVVESHITYDQEVKEGDEVELITNQTPFYAESGGQVGDHGLLISDSSEFSVTDCQKQGEHYLHIGILSNGSMSVGEKVDSMVDMTIRLATEINHSATHLLHAALRKVLGDDVLQKGSLVDSNRLRFDFSHPNPISKQEIMDIEDEVNFRIFCNDDVTTKIMTPSDAIERGAIALFGEKYGEKVRVVSIGKSLDAKRDAWSVELCGGTHVKRTSEILSFKIISETGVSSGVRRIEAVTNTPAIKFYNDKIDKVKNISNLLKTNNNQVEKKVEQLIVENQRINKELKRLKKNPVTTEKNNSVKETIKGIIFEYVIFDDLAIKELKSNAEKLIKNNKSDIVCLISKIDSKASLVIAVDNKIANKISAVEMVKEVSTILGGKGGGGRADMAQSGGSLPENSPLAIESLKKYIDNKF